MVGVDIGRYLEDEARELRLVGLHHALLGLGGLRAGSYPDKAVQQFLNAKVVQCRTEEDGSNLGLAIALDVELRIDAIHQFQVVTQLGGILLADPAVEIGGIELHADLLGDALLVGGEEVEFLFVDVIDALELRTLVDGPRQGAHLDFQLLLQLVEQVEGVTALTVHLVDEDDDGRIAHTAHRHQFAGLGLDALGTVDDDDGRIDSRQRAIGVLGKVLVARRVKDVHLVLHVRAVGRVVELHDRRRHRDAALLLNVHPVGGSRLLDLVVLDCTGHLNLSAKQQEFLCQRGLTGVGVRYDGECPPTFYFLIHLIYIIIERAKLRRKARKAKNYSLF